MKAIILCLLFQLTTLSLVAKPSAKMGIRAGLRKNHIETSSFLTDTSEFGAFEKFKGMKLKEIQPFFHFSWLQIFGELEGSYGWFDHGKDMLTIEQNLPFEVPPLSYDFKTRGEQISFSAMGGIPFRWSKNLFFAPIAGYSFDHHEIKRSDPSPDTVTLKDIDPFTNLIARADSTNEFKQDWKGPFAGAQFSMTRQNAYLFILRYSYHFLKTREKDRLLTQYAGKDAAGMVIFDNDYHITRLSKAKGTGHHLTYRWIYRLDRHWDFGMNTEYLVYTTGLKNNATVSVVDEDDILVQSKNEPTKQKWESYVFTIELSKRF